MIDPADLAAALRHRIAASLHDYLNPEDGDPSNYPAAYDIDAEFRL
ncbi:hypothetical protein ABT336_12165 [Micromonospora sp. NPDC000207]